MYGRFELWKKAYSEVTKSTERLLFGYGNGAHNIMVFQALYFHNIYLKFDSWDNHFAAVLLDTGYLGFLGFILLTIFFLFILHNIS